VAVTVFFDTSVLLAGLIDFGPYSAPAQTLMHAVAEGRFDKAATAWHCCLEFYSVATRLPPEYRLGPADAVALLAEEVFARMAVHDLPAANRKTMLRAAAATRPPAAGSTTCTSRKRREQPAPKSWSPTIGGTSCRRCATASESRRQASLSQR